MIGPYARQEVRTLEDQELSRARNKHNGEPRSLCQARGRLAPREYKPEALRSRGSKLECLCDAYQYGLAEVLIGFP